MVESGVFNTTIVTPMGPQKTRFTVNVDGDSWTGSNAGPMGETPIRDGRIEGNRLLWTMTMTQPFEVDLEGDALVEGNVIKGKIKAGAFGTFTLDGVRDE